MNSALLRTIRGIVCASTLALANPFELRAQTPNFINDVTNGNGSWSPALPAGGTPTAILLTTNNGSSFYGLSAPPPTANVFLLNGFIGHFDGARGAGTQFSTSTGYVMKFVDDGSGNLPFINITGNTGVQNGLQFIGSGTFDLGANLTVGGSGAAPLLLGMAITSVDGAFGITFARTGYSPAGVTTVSAANTYTGGTTLGSGIVSVGNAAAFGTGAVGTGAGNGTLIGSITLANTFNFTSGLTIGTNGLYSGGTSSITLSGTKDFSNSPTLTVSSGSTLTFSTTAYTGTSGFVKAGLGTLQLSAANTSSPSITLANGFLTLANTDAIGSNPLIVNGGVINATGGLTISGSLQLNASFLNNSGTTFTMAAPLSMNSGNDPRVFNTTGTITFAGEVSNTGTGAFVKSGPGALTLTGASTFSGGLVVSPTNTSNSPIAYTGGNSAGTVTLNGSGTLAVNSVTVAGGGFNPLGTTTTGTLAIDNSVNNISRFTTPNPAVNGLGGTFSFRGGASGSALALGALSLNAGVTTLDINPNGTAGTTMTFASLARNNRSVLNLTIPAISSNYNLGMFNAANPTPSPIAAGSNTNTAAIYFSSAPTGLVGGGGGFGTQTISIIPYILGPTTFGTTTNQGSLVTYGANGLRPLTLSEYTGDILSVGTVTAQNVGIYGAKTGINLDTTVNSIWSVNTGSNSNLTGTATITVTSGVFGIRGGVVNLGGVNFGTAEGFFHTSSQTTTVNALITGSNGWTKTGTGTLILGGPGNNTVSGPVTIVQGTVVVPDDTYLGNAGNAVTLSGGSLQLGGGASTRGFTIGETGGGVGTPGLSFRLDINGAITGNGTLAIASGTVVLGGTNSYTGGTLVRNAASLGIGAASAVPSGPITLENGSAIFASGAARTLPAASPVALTGSTTLGGTQALTFDGLITLYNTATIAVTNPAATNLNGGISSVLPSGSLSFNTTELSTVVNVASIGTLERSALSLTKSGLGTLNLNGPVSIGNGSISVAGGTLVAGGVVQSASSLNFSGNGTFRLKGAGALAYTSSISLNVGTELILDNTDSVVDRLPSRPSITMSGGGITLIGNATNPVTQIMQPGTLSFGNTTRFTIASPGAGVSTILSFGSGTSFSNFTGSNLFVRGDNLGTVGGAQFLVTGGSTFAGASGGGGAADTVNRTILVKAWGDSTSTGSGSGWLRYDTTLGLMLLNPATEYDPTLAVGTSTNNTRLATAVTAIDSATTINSLILDSGGSVSGTGTLTLGSGNLMSLGSPNTLSLGGISSTSNGLNIVAVGNLTIDSSVNFGTGGFYKQGPGILTLSGTSTGASIAYINDGTFRFGSPSALASATQIQLAPGATLDLNGFNVSTSSVVSQNTSLLVPTHRILLGGNTLTFTNPTGTFAGQITGSGSITMAGTGTLSFGRVPNYSGATTINSGTISVQDDTTLGLTALVTINTGATLTYSGSSQATIITTRPLALNGGNLNVGGGLTYAGTLSGTSNLTKVGSGSLMLTGQSTYTGSTIVGTSASSGGTLFIGGNVVNNANGVLGNGTADLQLVNGTLQFAPQLRQFDRGIVVGTATGTGSGSIAGSPSSFNAPSASLSIGGPVTLGRAFTINEGSVITVYNFNGVISNFGTAPQTGTSNTSYGLNLSNSSWPTPFNANFNAANTWTTGVSFSQSGNIGINNDAGLGTGPVFLSGVGLGGGATGFNSVNFIRSDAGARQVANNFNLAMPSNGGAFGTTITGLFPFTFTGQFDLSGESTTPPSGTPLTARNAPRGLSIAVGTTTISGNIVGSGALNSLYKAGLGALNLTGNNTFAGGLFIQQGFLGFVADNNLGGTAGVTPVNILAGSNGGLLYNGAAPLSLARAINLTANGAIMTTGQDLTLTNATPFTGTASFSVTKYGPGRLVVPVAFSNPIVASGGTFDYTATGTVSNSNVTVSNGNLNVAGSYSTNAAINITAGTLEFQGVDGGSTAAIAYTLTAGAIRLNNSTVDNANRINNGSALNISSSEIIYTGLAGGASAETVGAITSTNSTINFLNTVTIEPGTGGATLTASSLAKTVGNSAFLFRGTNLGTSSKFIATTAPTFTSGTGVGTPTAAVLIASLGDSTSTGTGSGFVRYDGVNGVTLLNLATEYATNSLVASNNINLDSGTIPLAASLTINSLRLAGGSVGNTGAASTLTISSGNILATADAAIGTPSNNVNVALGTSAGLIGVGTGATLTINGSLTQGTSLNITKVGGGKLVLNSATPLVSTIGIAGGTLSPGNAGPFGVGNIYIQNGNFDLNGFDSSITTLTTISGVLAPNATVSLGANSLTFLLSTSTYNGVFTGSGNIILTGNSTLNLGAVQNSMTSAGAPASPASTFTGNVLIRAGTLTLGRINYSGATFTVDGIASAASIDLGQTAGTANATMNLPNTGVPVTFGSVTQPINVRSGSGTRTFNAGTNTTLQVTGSGTGLGVFPLVTIASNFNLEGGITLTNSGYYRSTFSGAGAVTLGTSNSTNVFAGANTFTGGVTVNGTSMTLALSNGDLTAQGAGNASALGTGTLTLGTNSIGFSLFNGNAGAVALANGLAMTNTSISTGTSDFTLGGYFNVAFNGAVNLGTAPTLNRQIGVTNLGTDLVWNGAVSGSVAGFIKVGNGRLTLANPNNTLTAPVIVTAGFLGAAASNALGTNTVTVAAGGVLELSGNATLPNTIVASGVGPTINNFPTGAISNLSGNNTLSGTVTLGLAGTNAIGVASGNLNVNALGGIAGTTLTKFGLGNLALTGASTFTGLITVQNGALLVNGTVPSGGDVTVAGLATLGGGGTLNRNVILQSAANLSPGTSTAVPAALTINGSLYHQGAAVYQFGFLDNNTYSRITVNGNVTFSSNDSFTIRVVDFSGDTAPAIGPYTIFSATGAFTGFDPKNFSLDTSAGPAFNGATVSIQGTSVVISPLGSFWFTGASSNTWNAAANWATDPTGAAVATSVPGSIANVVLYANTFTNGLATLGADQAAKSLNIFGTASLTLGAGNKLTLGKYGIATDATVGAIVFNNDFELSANQSWRLRSTTNPVVINGVIGETGGSRALTKAEAGTLTLAGLNTFSGGMTLSGGTLNVTNGGSPTASSIGTGTFTIAGGTLANTSGSAVTLLTNNPGIWSGDFTFAGPNSVNLGTGTVTLSANLAVNVAAGSLSIGGISGTGFALTKNGTGTLNIGAGTAGTLLVNNGAFNLGGSVSGAATFAGGTSTFTGAASTLLSAEVNNAAAVVQFNSTATNVTGTAGLAVSLGAVTFAPTTTGTIAKFTSSGGSTAFANQSQNDSTVTGGTVTGYLGNNSANSTLTLSGATTSLTTGVGAIVKTANLSGGTGTLNATNPLTITGNGGAGTLQYLAGTNTVTVSVTSGAGFGISGANIVSAQNIQLAGGTVSLSGTSATLALPNTSFIANASTVLSFGNGNDHTFGLLSLANSGTTLTLSQADAAFAGISSVAVGGVIAAGTAPVALSIIPSNAITVASGDLTISAPITDWTNNGGAPTVTAITKEGAGTLFLNGINTFTGATTINAGAVNVSSLSSLGNTTLTTTVNSGGALQLQGGITIIDKQLSIAGTGVSNTGALRNISGSNTYGNTITLTANSRINSDAGVLTLANVTGAFNLTVGGTGNTNIPSVLGIGSASLTKDGPGTLTLAAANTYTGVTAIQGGTLNLSGSTSAASTVQVQSGGILAGTGTVNGNATIDGTGVIQFAGTGSILGSLTATGGNWNGAGSVSGPITVTGGTFTIGSTGFLTANSSLTFSGGTFAGSPSSILYLGTGSNIAYNTAGTSAYAGTILGTGNLVVNAGATANRLTLSGVAAYSGTTTITSGTLRSENAITGPGGAITINDGAFLEASGVIQRTLNYTGGVTKTGRVVATGNLTIVNPLAPIDIQGRLDIGANNVQLSGTGINLLRTATLTNGGSLGSGTEIRIYNLTGLNTVGSTGVVSIANGATATFNGKVYAGTQLGESAVFRATSTLGAGNTFLNITGLVRGSPTYLFLNTNLVGGGQEVTGFSTGLNTTIAGTKNLGSSTIINVEIPSNTAPSGFVTTDPLANASVQGNYSQYMALGIQGVGNGVINVPSAANFTLENRINNSYTQARIGDSFTLIRTSAAGMVPYVDIGDPEDPFDDFVANYTNGIIQYGSQAPTVSWAGTPPVIIDGGHWELSATSTELRYFVAAPVPEPATLLAFGAGLLGLGRFIRRRRYAKSNSPSI